MSPPRPRTGRLALVAACWLVVLSPAVYAASTTPTTTSAPSQETRADQPKPPTERERELRRELRDLERAWADGGGTFGYPFWEKARQRFAQRQITASMYREYVTGYRDRLVLGCDLVDQVDTSSEVAGDVRELVLEACEQRIDALRAQQRSLDEQIRRDGSDPDVDPVAIEERIGELDAEALEAMQASFRAAREAMDLAQSELDDAGLERLPEDAFV